MRTLTLATRNQHKTAEMAAILGPEWLVEDLAGRPELEAPEENGKTFEENAVVKVLAASRALKGLVLADDSGLEVDVLGGAPGIRSARYAGENATDRENRERLLAELAGFDHAATEPMAARFLCAMALAEAGKVLGIFSGRVEGRMVLAEAGGNGFGYDPLFIPDGYSQTFAELDPETKNRVSHRARAAGEVIEWLARRRAGSSGGQGTQNAPKI